MVPDTADLDPDGDVTLILQDPGDFLNGRRSEASGDASSAGVTTPDSDHPLRSSSLRVRRKTIDLRASSKHLALASPVLKTFLKEGFREGQELQDHGRTQCSLENDHPLAMLILLKIFHGRFSQVDNRIDLDVLVGIAVLVDKYDCFESVVPFVELWCGALRDTVPSVLNDETLEWLTIYRVFKKSKELKRLTKIAVLESYGELETDSLHICDLLGTVIPPYPHIRLKGLDAIDDQRQYILRMGIQNLKEFMSLYQEPKIDVACPRRLGNTCDALVLGSFTRGLIDHGLYPFPKPPFRGMSVKCLERRLEKLPITSLCREMEFSGIQFSTADRANEKCGLETTRQRICVNLRQHVKGVGSPDKDNRLSQDSVGDADFKRFSARYRSSIYGSKG